MRLPTRPRQRWWRSRDRAQDLIEYSLVVVVLAFVGLLGLKVLGGAEATVFGATAGTLAQPTPGTGTFLHQTQMTMNCGSPNAIYLVTLQPTSQGQATCTFTLKDLANPAPEPPTGSIQLQLDGTGYVCQLAAVSNTTSTCQWTHVWQVGEGDAPGLHSFSATYQPTSNHQSPAAQSTTFKVRPVLTFFLNCTDPWLAQPPANVTQIGQPLQCALQAKDVARNGPPPPLTGSYAPLVSSNGSNGGVPAFTCLPAHFSDFKDQTICPAPSTSWTCVTDTQGFCYFEYRRVYDASLGGTGADSINVLAFPSDLQSPNQTASVTIQPPDPSTAHSVGITVNCRSNAPGADFQPSPAEPLGKLVPSRAGENWGISLTTDHAILHTGTYAVHCTVVVFDGETPNPDFDNFDPTYGMPCPFADTRHCTAADYDAYPPLGTVSLVDQSTNQVYGPVQPLKVTPFAYTLPGQTGYASGCTIDIPGGTLPSGTTSPNGVITPTPLNFVYSPAEPGHQPGTSITINVSTN